MSMEFQENTKFYDLLNEGSTLESLKNKYQGQDIKAYRIHGLLGDNLLATGILSANMRDNPNKKYVLLISYSDASKKDCLTDLYSDLINQGKIVGLFLNETPHIGELTFPQHKFLTHLGCTDITDLYYMSKNYKNLKTATPYLGFEQPLPNNNKVALFRFSSYHAHVPKRHISEEAWNLIEQHLSDLNIEAHLYGTLDDTMKTLVKPENDHRGKLSILATIKHSADSGLCISTTTFLPHYLANFIPCLVYADPVDIHALCNHWRVNHNFMPIDTTKIDYVSYVIKYIDMWYLSNLKVENTIQTIFNGLQAGV